MNILMKLLMTLLVFLNLNSCTFPSIKPVPVGAINYYKDYCRVGNFDFNYGKLAALDTPTNLPLEQCHKWISISPDGWGMLIQYLDEIYQWKDAKYKQGSGPKTRSVPKELTPLGLLNGDF